MGEYRGPIYNHVAAKINREIGHKGNPNDELEQHRANVRAAYGTYHGHRSGEARVMSGVAGLLAGGLVHQHTKSKKLGWAAGLSTAAAGTLMNRIEKIRKGKAAAEASRVLKDYRNVSQSHENQSGS